MNKPTSQKTRKTQWLSSGPDCECDAHEETGTGESCHCFHRYGLSSVCCWCGDLFRLDTGDEPPEHGQYAVFEADL